MESSDFDNGSNAFDPLQFGSGLQFASNEDRDSAMQDHAFGDFGNYYTSNSADDLFSDEFDTAQSSSCCLHFHIELDFGRSLDQLDAFFVTF